MGAGMPMNKSAERAGDPLALLVPLAVLLVCGAAGWLIGGAIGLGVGVGMGALGAGTAFGSVLSAREKVRRADADKTRT